MRNYEEGITQDLGEERISQESSTTISGRGGGVRSGERREDEHEISRRDPFDFVDAIRGRRDGCGDARLI